TDPHSIARLSAGHQRHHGALLLPGTLPGTTAGCVGQPGSGQGQELLCRPAGRPRCAEPGIDGRSGTNPGRAARTCRHPRIELGVLPGPETALETAVGCTRQTGECSHRSSTGCPVNNGNRKEWEGGRPVGSADTARLPPPFQCHSLIELRKRRTSTTFG